MEAADFFDTLGSGFSETMQGYVAALGGKHATRNAGANLGLTIRQVQRVVLGEKLRSGETPAYDKEGKRLERWSGRGKVYNAAGREYEPRNLSQAKERQMVGEMREETEKLREADLERIKREGLTISRYRGDFSYDGRKPDHRDNRLIQAPVHIPGERLGRFVKELRDGSLVKATELFNEAYFIEYGAGANLEMHNVTQLVWQIGR